MDEIVIAEPGITVYGATWRPDCQRSKKFLCDPAKAYDVGSMRLVA